ncbi:fumarylacetoacetate hydrolase family protein [Aestuariivirga sp. YIM B02566]|uniref:Fumarylacetoacetate hydrolase family protein n=1 Tax=Taklimakanibacter albus TaxID=2800327 RepID=A0ACC5R3V5_9HYPH|nr:fumarylacetoacetate hydrolase family protein [Aestuariivirga sp. YIM B02566]MBK1867053.1 fumarylacetoacetate hydrolase family protein [Aestuariivirga sp. YIM B02566]
MKLLRYGAKGKEKPGVLDKEGRIRDLSGIIADISGETISPKSLTRLAKIKPESLPLVRGTPRIGPCVANPQKFIAIGLNYSDHAAESNLPVPPEPVVFTKHVSCISGPDDDVTIPPKSKKSDWEVELGVIIGTRAKNIKKKDALAHVAGYCTINDLSEREFQIERAGQWTKGKSYDTFGPIGPWLVTTDEVKDPQKLKLWLELNGKKVQDGSTSTMVFGVAHIVAYLSQFFTLMPGDIITTGTPPGVGMGMKPQRFLKPGDVMRIGIEGLGVQQQKVVRDK